MVTGVGAPIHRLSRKTTEDTETPQKTQKFFLCVLCASLRLCVTLGVLGVNLFAPSAPLRYYPPIGRTVRKKPVGRATGFWQNRCWDGITSSPVSS